MITALALVLGCGSMSFSSAPVWTATVADVLVVGPLEDAAFVRAIEGGAARLHACNVHGEPESEFAARLDVGNDGRVAAVGVRVSSGNAKVDQCLAQSLKKIRFTERRSSDPSIAVVVLELGRTNASVIAGKPIYTGPTDKDLLRKIIQRHLNPIRHCYDTGRATNPALAGTVTVAFTIDASGHVSQSRVSQSSLGAASVETCVAEYVKKVRFPAPKGGGIANVTYPFTFKP